MNKLKSILIAVIAIPLLVSGLVAFVPSSSVLAADVDCEKASIKDDECRKIDDTPTCLFGKDDEGNECVFGKITNTALFIIGAVSVLMLIYGGIRYTISGGDASAVTAAKNTILYAIVGIVVAVMAYAIVNFVLTRIM